jgi:predicted negative regulator of RcsB-dependent stress response
VIQIEPDDSDYWKMGDVLMGLDKSSEAIAIYRQAIAKSPTDFNYQKLAEAQITAVFN